MLRQERKHLILLIVLGVLLASVYFSGPDPHFDDALYVKYAGQVLAGNFTILQTPYAYGIAYIYSLAGAQMLFGSVGPSLLQILEYIAIVVVVYYTCLKYFTPKIALATSLSLEMSMFILGYASRVLPDMLLGLAIAVIFLVLAYRKDSLKWVVIAGFLSGATLIVKLGGFIAVFPLVLFFLLSRKISYLAGFILAILAIQIFMPIPLTGMANAYLTNQANLSQATVAINLQTMVVNMFGYVPATLQVFPIGAALIFALFGTMLVLIKRDRRFYLAVFVFWVSLSYLYFGTESFTSYTSITVVSRYFIELCAPMCLLAGVCLDKLRKWTSENKIIIGAVLFTLITNLPMYVLFFFKRLPIF